MSHQAFPKTTGTTTDGHVLTYSSTDGYWKPGPHSIVGGWKTAYDVDFRTATPQTISADGPFTVSGKTWNMVNYASADSVVINSSGLTINCNATNTDFANATRTAAMVTINLSEVIENYDPLRHVVRIWAWNSANNADADFELAFLSLDRTQGSAPINRMLHMYKKGFINGLGGLVHYANGCINNNTQGDIQSTANYSDDVFIIQQGFPGDRSYQCLSGVYNTGGNDWPTISNLRYRWNYLMNYGAPGTVLNIDEATTPFKVSIGAQTVNTSNTFEVTFARIKIEYLDIGILGGNAGGDLSGTYPNPTVTRIQTIPVNSAAPSDGHILTYVGADGYWAPRQGTSSRYTPTDSNTIINWKLDETASPYANSGAGSALNLTTFTGTPASVTGIFNKALGCSGTIISSGNSSVNEVTGTSLSVSVWVRARSFASFGTIFNKAYRNNNSWSSPFVSIYLSFSNTGDGSWGPAITTGAGVLTQPFVGGAFRVTLGVWTLLSYTYDGSNLRSYINGALANTTAVTGAIDYGTHGPWDIGGVSNAGVNQFWDGHIDDLRIENVVRSQAYFEDMYKSGINLRD